MQLVVHGADPQPAPRVDTPVVQAVVGAAFDLAELSWRTVIGRAAIKCQILREQVGAIRRQSLTAEEVACVRNNLMSACRRIERLMQPPVDVDPPQSAGAVAPQWRLAEDIAGGDRGLDPMCGDHVGGHPDPIPTTSCRRKTSGAGN